MMSVYSARAADCAMQMIPCVGKKKFEKGQVFMEINGAGFPASYI